MLKFNLETRFVVCINNQEYQASLEVRKIYQIIPDSRAAEQEYQASLEVRKIYQIIPDSRAAEHQFIRVIDESGEDYLYPVAYFVPIELPKAVEVVFA